MFPLLAEYILKQNKGLSLQPLTCKGLAQLFVIGILCGLSVGAVFCLFYVLLYIIFCMSVKSAVSLLQQN